MVLCIPLFRMAITPVSFLFRPLEDKGSELNGKRRLNSLTLAKHTGLLELLELPQIMESCVRSSYYEEALELSAFVKRLEKKHSHISVIAVSHTYDSFSWPVLPCY